MVISTDNRLLLRHTPTLQPRSLKNPLLGKSRAKKEENPPQNASLSKPSRSLSTNVLLEKLSPSFEPKKETLNLENSLLKNATEKSVKMDLGRTKIPTILTENKLLKDSNSQGRCGGFLTANHLLKNSLLEKAASQGLQLRNPYLRGTSKLSLRRSNALLAPSFSLSKQTLPGADVSEDDPQGKVVFSTHPEVEPPSSDDFANAVSIDAKVKFPTTADMTQAREIPTSSLDKAQISLIECVCTSLINHPVWFSATDPTRTKLLKLSEEISNSDPEFILKVALYARVELNIRATCNFLLAVASLIPSCRPYLKKYFAKSTVLPSDWIQVTEFYKSITDEDGLKRNLTLPAALRKVMASKFPDFDEYQLAKYNKDKSVSKKKRKEKKKKEEGNKRDEEKEVQEETNKKRLYVPSYTLKFIIRNLHVMKPAQAVMRILGKKYPESVEEYNKCGLEGKWDSALAGKRMKLEVPETWETQVSAKGNIAKTWQDLLDHKKLPFMAMLRNLRNMIKAGISEKHHQQVLKTLTNEKAVKRSRQFPFRFFSAYEVLKELQGEIEKQAKYKCTGVKAFLKVSMRKILGQRKFGDERPKTDEEKKLDFIKKQLHKKYGEPFKYDEEIIKKYQKALDEAVKIATLNNVPPIPGHTVVLCDARSETMQKLCTTSKGLGSSRTLQDVGILLGLMCAYSCEACTFVVCAGGKFKTIELEKGGILKNLSRIVLLIKMSLPPVTDKFLPEKFLDKILLERIKLDNLLVLSGNLKAVEEKMLGMFLERYKDDINRKMLCFKVDLAGKRPSVENDIGILSFSGYSEQILKFIAIGSTEGRLRYVSTIDKRLKLENMEEKDVVLRKYVPAIMPLAAPTPWKTVRVFISSTIKDMGSERDVLVLNVFPGLKDEAKKRRIHLVETDLRWGITGEDSRYDRNVAICLREVRKCDIFIAILGERYGWIPPNYGFSEKGSEWLEDYPNKRSITELEIVQAAFQDEIQNKDCYFYFRDSSEIKHKISKSLKEQFFETNSRKKSRLRDLKQRILESNHRVAEPYCPEWGGIVNKSLTLKGLEDFEKMVTEDLKRALEKFDASERETDKEMKKKQEIDPHNEISQGQIFAGRSSLLATLLSKIAKMKNVGALLALVGKKGSGKTSLLAGLHRQLSDIVENGVLCVHFAHSSLSEARSPKNVLFRLCNQIVEKFNMSDVDVSADYVNLLEIYPRLLEKVKSMTNSLPNIYLLVDDLDAFSDIDFVTKLLQEGVTIVATCLESGSAHKALKHDAGVTFHPMPDLSISEKREIVRATLGQHSKKLDESHFNNQLQALLSKQQSVSPLYLASICEVIRVQETYESLTKTLKNLPHDLHGALKWQITKAESRFCHHPGIVPAIFGLIHCSMRWKISEDDLYDVLCSSYNDPRFGECKNQVPKALMHTVLNSLRSFVSFSETRRGILLSISHLEHMKALEAAYMTDEKFVKSCHRCLADFYSLRLKNSFLEIENDESAVVESLSKLPTHLAESNQQEILRKMLSSIHYIHLKCKLGLGNQILDDFLLIGEEKAIKGKVDLKKAVAKPWKEMEKFVKSRIHIISAYPDMIFQEALNEPKDSHTHASASEFLTKWFFSQGLKMICVEKVTQKGDLPCLQTYDDSLVGDSRSCIAAYPKSKYVAWGSVGGKVGVLEKHSTREKNVWAGHSDEVTALTFVNKSILLSAGADGMMSVWNITEGYKVSYFKAHEKKISAVAVRPLRQGASARVFVTASHDRSIAIWSVSSYKFVGRITISTCVNAIAFHPHDPKIVAGLWDASLLIWNVQTSKRIAVIRGHSHAVSAVQYTSCGTYIASCSAFETCIRLWAANTGIPLGNFAEAYLTSPRSLTFSDDGEYLIGAGDGTNENIAQLTVWNSHLGNKELQYNVPNVEEYGNTLCCRFNKEKTLLAVGFHEGYLNVFDPRLPDAIFTEKIHDSAITCVAWTPGPKDEFFFILFNDPQTELLITGSVDGNLKALNPKTQSVVAILEGHASPVIAVDCSEKWIASGAEDFAIFLWRTEDINPQDFFQNQLVVQSNITNACETNKPRIIKHAKVLRSHEAPVSCVAFHPEGTMLVSGGRDGKLAYWHTGAFDFQNSFQMQVRQNVSSKSQNISPFVTIDQAHMDWITCCSWNDSSDHVVTGSNDATLKIWRCPSMPLDGSKEHDTPLIVLTGHSSGITSVVYKFGCIVSTGGEDNSIRIWSHKGAEITNLKTDSRTNSCDIALHFESDEDSEDSPADEERKLDWAEEVEAEEWDEEHQKQKPGGKRKRKAMALEMQNFNVVSGGNDASVSLWKPLSGQKINIMNEQAKSVTHVTVSREGEVLSLCTGGRIKLWSTTPAGQGVRQRGEVTGIVTLQDVALTTCSVGFLYVWSFDSDGEMGILYKARAHSKRITAISKLHGNEFATASYDCTVVIWTISTVENGKSENSKKFCVREKNTTQFASPLFSLTLDQSSPTDPMLWVADFQGNCTKMEPNARGTDSSSQRYAPPNHKVLRYVEESGDSGKMVTDKGHVTGCVPVPLQNSEFVHCYGSASGLSPTKTLLLGSSRGLLYLPHLSVKKKIHESRVTAILDTEDFIITASHDCTIKIWSKPSLDQIGQYFNSSPVTAACLFEGKSVIYGDSSGIMNVLKLHSLA